MFNIIFASISQNKNKEKHYAIRIIIKAIWAKSHATAP